MAHPASILLIEDERDQAQLIQEVLQSGDSTQGIQVVETGEDAIAYLSGAGQFADRRSHPFPAVVLLDLKMPGIGGFGVLRWLRMHPEISEKLKVAVISSAQSIQEIEVAYELGALLFLPKSDCQTLQARVQHLKETWLGAE